MLQRILLPLLLVSAFNIQAVTYYPDHLSQQQVQVSPKIKAWDIHKVLAARERGKLGNMLTVFKIARKAMVMAACNLLWAKITGRPNDASRAYEDINNMPKSADASGEAYVMIFEKHNLPEIAHAVEEVSNSYKPQPGMQEIVQQINAAGIIQRFASNIGPRLFENLKEKFLIKHKSNLFDLILPGKFVNYSHYGKSANITAADYLATVGKPHPEFFAEFNKTYNSENNSVVVFVDDSLPNIQAAVKNGWVGIHYDATKPNAQAIAQLKNDLAEVGILKV